VFIAATIGGGVLDLLRINPMKALYWTAIVNGVLAPFLLLALLLVANDRRVMRGQPSSRLARTTVGVTMVIMFAAAIGMFIF
jgi:Mn2+/Fe2+ NRAMP family transporter